MWMFNVLGQAKTDRMLEVFEYAVRRHGVSHVVIDSLMMIEDVPEEGRGALEAQRQFMNKLAAFAKRNRVHVHLVAHPRKAEDERRAPGKQDVSGSGKITSLADNHLSVWARPAEEGDTGPDSKLELNKQRNGDEQHRELWLWFDQRSKQHCNSSHRRARKFVELERSA
jgi:twinkle protein